MSRRSPLWSQSATNLKVKIHMLDAHVIDWRQCQEIPMRIATSWTEAYAGRMSGDSLLSSACVLVHQVAIYITRKFYVHAIYWWCNFCKYLLLFCLYACVCMLSHLPWIMLIGPANIRIIIIKIIIMNNLTPSKINAMRPFRASFRNTLYRLNLAIKLNICSI